MKRISFTFYYLFFALLLLAQPICSVKEYASHDGLGQSIVNGIIQDKKGFLWISTWSGINKFDGYTFINFKPSSNSAYARTNNRITYISETIDGNIWCQSYDSRAYIFDTQKNVFFDVLKEIEREMQRDLLVRRIYHFHNGVAWIVCEDGLCFRINESNYAISDSVKLYNTFNSNLKGSQVYGIYQDAENDEWVLTNKGISLIGNKRITNDFPFRHLHEHNGRIFLISTLEKLAVYQPKNQNIQFIDIPYPVKSINSIVSMKSGQVALCTNNGLLLFNPESNKFARIDLQMPTQPSNHILSLYEDKEGEWWMFVDNYGVIRYNPATAEKQHLYTPAKDVLEYGRNSKNLIYEDPQGTLWVLPNKGNLSYFDRKTKSLRTYYTDPQNPKSIFSPLVRYHYNDRQGNLWLIGSRGIQRMSFYPHLYELQQTEGRNMETRAFLSDNEGQLWAASKNGIIKIYNSDGSFKGYFSPQGTITNQRVKFGSNIYSTHQAADGTIWLGTKCNGLYRLQKKRSDNYSIEHFIHDETDKYSISCNDVYSIYTNKNGQTWIGTYGGGLNLFSETPGQRTRFIHCKNELKNYPGEGILNVRIITEVNDSVMLVGTTNGIISFSSNFRQTEEVIFYQNKHQKESEMNMLGCDVMDIYSDSKGDIYVLTFTGGINVIRSENLLSDKINYKHYSYKEGLPSDLLLSVIEDRNNNLWIVAENGLCCFNPSTGKFENYDKTFLHDNFNFTEAIPVTNAQGELVFGTDMGILTINPEQIKKSDYSPYIAFTNLKVHGEPSGLAIDDISALSLDRWQRNITIQFAALDYINPESINYAYRLKGLEEQWNYSEKNRNATYINLPPGDYLLEVKSTNTDGEWMENTRRLSIHVVPTFWETRWAWLVYLFCSVLVMCIIMYVVFYIYRLRHKVDVEHQLSNMKLRFFTDISHELRTPLTLITTPVSEIMEEEENLSVNARKHLRLIHNNTQRMLRLIDQILDFRKLQNNKMKLLVERTDIVSFLFQVFDTFSLIANEKSIDYTFGSSMKEAYIWIDRDKIEKVIYNLLSNAFKYTLPNKSIRVNIGEENNCIIIQVEDEGIGIAADKMDFLFKRFETFSHNSMQPSFGIGLALVKELVEMHHGTIEAISQPDKGSCFCLSLPMSRICFEGDEKVEFILADGAGCSELETSDKVDILLQAEIQDEQLKREDTQSVLIVEDNEELRILLHGILSKTYCVIEACNGEEGIRKAKEKLPDLIITDVMMPILDGLAMISQIKSDSMICHIPIIVLSAKSSIDDRIKGVEYGVDDYITKPFSASYLKAKVTAVFTQRRQLQEAFMGNIMGNQVTETSEVMLEPTHPQVTAYDQKFIAQIMAFMEEHMANSELMIDDFADKFSMSRSMFYRKLKSITGLTPVDFIREVRFKRAIQLMECGQYNFSEIAYMTGFNDPKYFSKSFKKYIGVSPREYKESMMHKNNDCDHSVLNCVIGSE